MKDYWRDKYGPRSEDFIEGIIAGVEAFAIWKDGKQMVGILRIPLEEIIKEIKKELSES